MSSDTKWTVNCRSENGISEPVTSAQLEIVELSKIIEIAFVGGFRDGEVLSSRNFEDLNEVERLWMTHQGKRGNGFVSISDAAFEAGKNPHIDVASPRFHRRHQYTVADCFDDGTTVRVTYTYSIAK